MAVTYNHYYDAAALTPETDFGADTWGYLGRQWNGLTRQIVLGRLRRSCANNPYLRGLVEAYPASIGHCQVKHRSSDSEWNYQADDWFRRYSRVVTSNALTWAKLETIIWQEMLIAGEVFLIFLASGQVQIVPAEYCGTMHFSKDKDQHDGITYNASGRPVTYHFAEPEIGSYGPIFSGNTKIRSVPARDVIHIRKIEGQYLRGLPWLIASLRPFQDLHELTRAKIMQIKSLDSIIGVIESDATYSSEDPMTRLSQQTALNGEPFTDSDAADARERASTSDSKIELKTGSFPSLPVGAKLKELTRNYNVDNHRELILHLLKAGCAPIGFAPGLWIDGIEDINFSGYKGLAAQWLTRRTELREWAQETWLDRLYFWRASKAVNLGELTHHPDMDSSMKRWQWKSIPVLDEERQARTHQVNLKNGTDDVFELMDRSGETIDEVLLRRTQSWYAMQVASGEELTSPPKCWLYRGHLPEDIVPSIIEESKEEKET